MRVLSVAAVVAVIVGCTVPQTVRSQSPFAVDASNLTTMSVNYTDEGTPLMGFVAYDSTTDTKRPAVLIVPPWDGIGEYTNWRAQLLANMGYVGFVTDIYTAEVEQPVQNMTLRGQLTSLYRSDPELYRSRLLAALDQVKQLPQVEPTNIVAIGYCFGGSGVIELARAWPDPRTDGLQGVMAFHPGSITSPAGNMTEGVPIYISVQHGFDDPSPGEEQILEFKNEMEAANATWEFTSYGKTVHSFTDPSLPEAANVHGVRSAYSRTADLRSWWALRGFLLQVFGQLDVMGMPYTGQQFDYRTSFVPSE